MPRIDGDGGGGGDGSAERSTAQGDSSAAFVGWLGSAARTMTGSTGGSYVVLGGTRYGLRLSQDSLPAPAAASRSREESPERRQRRERDPRGPGESRERLTDAKPSLELLARDCCCIGGGPRSRLLPPGSRVPASWSAACGSGGAACVATASAPAPPRHQQQQQQQQRRPASPPPPPDSGANNSRRCWPSSCPSAASLGRASSSGCGHGALGCAPLGRRQCAGSGPGSSLASSTSSSSSSCSSSSGSPSGAGSCQRLQQQQQQQQQRPRQLSAGAVLVPRQLAQWTKHQSLGLQEPAATAVDRLQRFRWSGGGGSSASSPGGKKSSPSSRTSDKAERLRELTEKLKGPAPVPPPRRPSRHHAYSPSPTTTTTTTAAEEAGRGPSPSSSLQQPAQPLQQQLSNRVDGRLSCRSYTFSEGSGWGGGGSSPPAPTSPSSSPGGCGDDRSSSRPRHQLARSESVDDERQAEPVIGNGEATSGGSPTPAPGESDGGAERTGRGACCDNEARDSLAGLMEPIRSASSLFTCFGPGQPYRSASFGQADCSYGSSSGGRYSAGQSIESSRRAASAAAAAEREARASTLPRARRAEGGPGPPAAAAAEGAPTLACPRAALGSRASTTAPSLEPARPRSDGSDGAASVLGSPEAAEQQQQQQRQPGPEGRRSAEVVVGSPATQPGEAARREPRLEPHEVIITPPQEESQPQRAARPSHQASEPSEAPSESGSEAPGLAPATTTTMTTTTTTQTTTQPAGKLRRYRGDTSKRRKGVYITQWPEPAAGAASEPAVAPAAAVPRLAGQSSEERDEPPPSATPSDLSDCEGQAPRRYSKRPLRGPYGQMLEAEMAKPRAADIGILDDGLRQRRKVSANLSFNASSSAETAPTPHHQRTTSSPSKLEGLPGPSPELLAELLRGSSERVARSSPHQNEEVLSLKYAGRLTRASVNIEQISLDNGSSPLPFAEKLQIGWT